MVKAIASHADFDQTLSSAGAQLVVVDFHATWCGPCHAIAPTFESLAGKYPNTVFCKVDVDKVASVAQKYSVRAMPTFLFIRSGSVIETLQGASPPKLTQLVEKHSKSSASSAAFSGTGHTLSGAGSSSGPGTAQGGGVPAVVKGIADGHSSLLQLIDVSQSSALNEDPVHNLRTIVKGPSGGLYLQSDADEQLLISLSFTQKVRISSLLLRTSAGATSFAPRNVRVFANRPTLSFDDAENDLALSELELNADDVKSGTQGGGGRAVSLKFVKFQNVDSVQIAIMTNQGNEPVTRIDAIDIFGLPSEANTGTLTKVEGAGGPRDLGRFPPSRTGLKGGTGGPRGRTVVTGHGAFSSSLAQSAGDKPDVRQRRGSSSKSGASASPERDGFRPNGSTSNSATAMEPPTLALDPDDTVEESIAEYAFGGWHYAPLIIAIAPPVGAMVGGRADAWTDAILILLASFWLYQFLRVPWEMYTTARTRRVLSADSTPSDDGLESPERRRARNSAASELRRAELVSLAMCIVSPLFGGWVLSLLQQNLTDGDRYLNHFNIRLFMLAAGIKPWTHGFKLIRRRLLLLQEDVHFPSTKVELLSRQLKRLEAEQSTLRKIFATKTDIRTLRDGIDVPLTHLTRAVRRTEKKEEHLRLSADDKFTLVEHRLEDLLREVAINAELIEEERRERERAASLPISIISAFKLLLGQRGAGQARHYLNDVSRTLPSTSSLGIGPPEGYSHEKPPQKTLGPPTSVDTNLNVTSGSGSPPAPVPFLSMSYSTPHWYEQGALYWIFLPVNAPTSVLRFASSKLSNIMSNAGQSGYAYHQYNHNTTPPHTSNYGSHHTTHGGTNGVNGASAPRATRRA